MSNIYKGRYKNALKKAARINRFIKKGYHVFHGGSPIKDGAKFVMRDGELLFKANSHTSYIFYKNDKDWDHGYWTKISDFNNDFNDSFQVYAPQARVDL